MADITFPMLADGSVDWDHVFNDPGTGLVTQIDQARSANDLQLGMQLILKTLFNREGDSDRRKVFTNLVNEILAHAGKTKKSPAAAMTEVKARVIQILHSIKEDRQKRARKALAAKARKAQEAGLEVSEAKLGYEDRQSEEVHIAVAETPAPVQSPTAEPEPQPSPVEIEQPGADAGGEDDDFIEEQEEAPAVADAQVQAQAQAQTQEKPAEGEEKTPEQFFANVIAASIMAKLEAVRGDLKDYPTDGATDTKKLPFILSPAFAGVFEAVIREHVLPDFIESSYVTISHMNTKPKATWQPYLKEVFSDQSQSLMLWERWQMAWTDRTEQRDEPPAPVVDPAKQGFRGFMTKLLGSDDVFIEDIEETPEEWEESVEITREENERARQVWSQIAAPSNEYDPPSDSDNHLLMTLFRGPENLEDHMAKFRHMAENSETAGRVFDDYMQGKDLDLPLLAACYRYPDELMSGEKTAVSNFVAGLDRRRGEVILPLCCRFLGSAMGQRFSDEPVNA